MLRANEDLNQDELNELQSTPFFRGCAERVHSETHRVKIATFASKQPHSDPPKFYAAVNMPGRFSSTELYATRTIALEWGKRLADQMEKDLDARITQLRKEIAETHSEL